MHTLTKGSFMNSRLEDDKPTLMETPPLKQEKVERDTEEKEAGRTNAAQGSNRALLVLFITICLISLVVLLLTLLMLFGKIGSGCGCSTEEGTKDIENSYSCSASSAFTKSPATISAKMKALEENITSLQLGLLEYLGAELTGLKSNLNRTNTDLAELKSTHTKEKVIYHQSMTPSWLEAHASYINSDRSSTAEQLTFNAGSVNHASLLKVPLIPANVLQNSTMLTVRIVVSNDVSIGTSADSDTRYGVSDGISFLGFWTVDKHNYFHLAPCYGMEISPEIKRNIDDSSPRPSDSFYPGQFVFTLKLDGNEIWGSCYTAHDGGFVKTVVYKSRLNPSKGLTLEVYKYLKGSRVGIKFIEVTIVDDL